MNTLPNESACPKCGKPVSLLALEGLCPQCLMQAGFGTVTGAPGDDKRSAFVPPTPEELAQHFPQLEILKLLGRGGMGAVYKARQTHLDRIVALKILPPGISAAPAFAERFGREARALARLHHPHIVTLYESGQTGDLFYFLMEYVDGVNLRQLLAAGTISPKDALAIVPQICDALQFAHDRGIVHRDIKPENILLNKAGQVKIADFGVAKLVAGESVETSSTAATHETGQTEVGKIIGTPQYMAPEQISHPLEVDNRADIYALGVVFYQMLTGELPVGKFEPPSHKVRIDVRLDEIVLRALEKQPELRYPQASVLKTQVEMIAHGSHEPLSPHVQSTLTRSTPASGTQIFLSVLRWLAVAFTVFILCVIGGGIILPRFLPKTYKAQATLMTKPNESTPDLIEPYAFASTVETIRSPDVLLPVIRKLDLEKAWARRGVKSDAGPLTDTDALTYLNKNLTIEARRGTRLVDITVLSDVPKEAASMANEVTYQYLSWYRQQAETRKKRGITALRDQITQQQSVLATAEATLAASLPTPGEAKALDLAFTDWDLKKSAYEQSKKDMAALPPEYANNPQFLEALSSLQKLADDQTRKLAVTFTDPLLRPFVDARNEVKKQESLVDALNTRLRETEADPSNQQTPVVIVELASVPFVPVKPSPRLMLAASTLVGIVLGFIVATGLEIVLWTRRTKAIQPAMRSQPSASSPQKGKVLAIAGAIFQPGSILAIISVNVWQIMKLTAQSAHGPTTMTVLANAMQVLLSVTVAALALFFGSLVALCIALVVSRYRANWFYHFLTIYSWPLLLIFPFGTAAGIFFLVYCLKRRDEFASSAPSPSVNPSKP